MTFENVVVNSFISSIFYHLFYVQRSINANEKLVNSESAENIAPIEPNPPTTSSPRIRDRYLNRLGVGSAAGDDNEDELPLLNDN